MATRRSTSACRGLQAHQPHSPHARSQDSAHVQPPALRNTARSVRQLAKIDARGTNRPAYNPHTVEIRGLVQLGRSRTRTHSPEGPRLCLRECVNNPVRWTDWWAWDLELSPHVYKRMADRGSRSVNA